jgi:CDP-paratose 2-epimerase
VQALLTAHERLSERSAGFIGEAFNIGGGPDCSLSLIELVDYIAELLGERPLLRFAPWRVGDQRYYVSDTSKFAAASGRTRSRRAVLHDLQPHRYRLARA